MSRFDSYLRSARSAIEIYRGDVPFAVTLKQFFAGNKKFGSTDRKIISHLCYCFFRTGHLLKQPPQEDVLLKSLFLCSEESNEILSSIKPGWNEHVASPLDVKCTFLSIPYFPNSIFPWVEELSQGIDANVFCHSFLRQPDLFLRIRPGHKKMVLNKLSGTNIQYSVHGDLIAFPSKTSIEKLLLVDQEAVIQDQSSQQVAGYFLLAGSPHFVWDACAGSGGKSILAYDNLSDISLTVTDKRPSILVNLEKRFRMAGIKRYKTILADLTKVDVIPQNREFDLVIADVPCTGSGTWGRTPEQLYFFDSKRIDEYADLQRSILRNIMPHVRKGGCLLYITCSAFKKENEEQVEFLKANAFELIRQSIIAGYDRKADTMFAAILRKS